MFKRLQDFWKRYRKVKADRKYSRITGDYIITTNELHHNYDEVANAMPQFKGIKIGFFNSLETVYLAFKSVYGDDLALLQIRGFHIDISEDVHGRPLIIFNIYTPVPGFVNGYKGLDLAKLNAELNSVFGVRVEMNVIADCKLLTYQNF